MADPTTEPRIDLRSLAGAVFGDISGRLSQFVVQAFRWTEEDGHQLNDHQKGTSAASPVRVGRRARGGDRQDADQRAREQRRQDVGPLIVAGGLGSQEAEKPAPVPSRSAGGLGGAGSPWPLVRRQVSA